MNESLWRVSMLNLAKRKMEKKGMIKARNGINELGFPVMIVSTHKANEI